MRNTKLPFYVRVHFNDILFHASLASLLNVELKINDVTDSSMFKDKLQLSPKKGKFIRLISNRVSISYGKAFW